MIDGGTVKFALKKVAVKYVIIGAVAGGATAAARLRRLDEKTKTVIFDKGEYISLGQGSGEHGRICR